VRPVADQMRPEDAPFDGRWWIPEDPNNVVGGRLELEGEIWRLTLFGWLGPWSGPDKDSSCPKLILGQVGTIPVSLLDLVPGGWESGGFNPPHRTQTAVNTAICGSHVDETTKFVRAAVRLSHLNEWANRRPWSSAHDVGTPPGLWKHTTVFTDPGEQTADILGAKVTLERSWGQSGGNLSGLTMTSDEWVSFDFEEPLDLDTIGHDYVRPLRNLVELAAADSSAIIELTVTPEGADPLTPSSSVLTSAIRAVESSPKPAFRFLFTLTSVNFAEVVPTWWDLQARIGIVTDLVSSLWKGGNVSNTFLNAASAIEGYHRHKNPEKETAAFKSRVKRIVAAVPEDEKEWLKDQLRYGWQTDYAERIDEVIALAGPRFTTAVGNPTEWRDWVKRGRNSVAHRDPKMIDIDREWRTTIRITATMQWLLILVLLVDLKVPADVVAAGLQQDRGLESASHFLREVKPDWFSTTP
jgi:hypothetical protein